MKSKDNTPTTAESVIIRVPTPEEAQAAFEAYTNALGRCAYAWNFLLSRLGSLFAVVVGADRHILLNIWHAPESDRAKIDMLHAAVAGSKPNRWLPKCPSARDDIEWLCSEAGKIAEPRNNAVHAPVTLTSMPNGRHEMMASVFSHHSRAKKLASKDLLVEFDWLERWTEELSRFTERAESALHPSGIYPWPDKPRKPDRRQKKDLPGQRLPDGPMPHQPPPQSSGG